jgi:hypothetical protein
MPQAASVICLQKEREMGPKCQIFRQFLAKISIFFEKKLLFF